MDHGTLTDNNGRKADFRNVVIIMTTNAGSEALNKSQIGFTKSSSGGDELMDIKRTFTPEFRNRLDAIISFAPLDHEVILRVVDKFLMQLEEQLHEKKVEVLFTDALKDYLAEQRFRSADGRTPDGTPDPGHHPLRAGRRTAVRQAGKRRQGDGGCDADGKVKLEFAEEAVPA